MPSLVAELETRFELFLVCDEEIPRLLLFVEARGGRFIADWGMTKPLDVVLEFDP